MTSWTDVAAWVGAIGTWVAIGAAGLATWASIRLLRIERDRDQSSIDAASRTQASMVSVWMNRQENDLVTTRVDVVMPSIEGQNASPLPIYNVRIYLWVGDGPRDVFLWQDLSVLPPTLAPYEMSSYQVATSAQRGLMRSNTGVSIEFWDAAGNHWYRARKGILYSLQGDCTWQTLEGVPPETVGAMPPDWMLR